MKLNQNTLLKIMLLFSIILINALQAKSASVTSLATGNWSSASTWSEVARTGTISSSTTSNIVTGDASASFTTTLSVGSQILNASSVVIGTVASIESNTSLTLVANATTTLSNASWRSKGVGSGDDLTIASGHTITLDGNYACASINFPTVNAQTGITFSGTNALNVSGDVSMARPASTGFTCLLRISAGSLTMNNLTMSATTTGRFNQITISSGNCTINGNITSGTTGCVISITTTGTLQIGGSSIGAFTLTPNSTSTVIYSGGVQTVRPATYNNLTLGGSGLKTTTSVSVNGTLTLEGTATITAAVTYGSAAGLKYNTSTARTSSLLEWPASFSPTGGVQIANTGTITLNSSRIMSTGANLSIAANSTLNTGNFDLTLNANFTNSGTFIGGSSKITLNGTATQSIGAITTTGSFTSTKSGGTATLTGNISAGTLLVNTAGGTLHMGTSSLTHSFSSVSLTAGTVNGGNATINISGDVNRTSGIFTPSTSTVNYNGTNQSTSISDYYNLVFSGSGNKSITGTTTVSNLLTTKGSAIFNAPIEITVSGDISIEETSTINIGPSSFSVQNISIGNGGVSNLIFSYASSTITVNGNFNLNANAVFDNSINQNISIVGNMNLLGNAIVGDATYGFTGTNQTINTNSIISFHTLAVFGTLNNTGQIEIRNTISGTGTFVNKNELYVNTNNSLSITNLDASSNTNTVYYIGTSQNLKGTNYYTLQLKGSLTKQLSTSTTSIVNLIASENVIASLSRDLTISGNVTVQDNAALQFSTYSTQIQGNISVQGTGTIDFGTSTINLSGSTQSISNTNSAISFYNLTSGAGTKTLACNTSINNILTLEANSIVSMRNNVTLTLNCTISGSGMVRGASCNSISNNSISFEKSNTSMGSINIDPSNNLFYDISIKNNASVTLVNDIQVFNTINLVSGNITFNNGLYLHTSNTPIVKTSGFMAMATGSSMYFSGCTTSGNNFELPANLFSTTPILTNLTVNRTNGIRIGTNTIKVSGVLTLTDGNLNTNNTLILTSTASGTARVAPISATASLSGFVTVERFIPGGLNKRKWRLLSFPVNISGGIEFNQLIDNVLITAPAGIAGGFDVNPLNPANTASLRTYNESITGAAGNGWTDPNTINASIITGTGFELFVRGSRNLANPYLSWTVPDDVTLDYLGNLNVNDVNMNLSYTNTGNPTADGFNLVGNPYASPINFDTTNFTSTNIQNKFWSYNPNTGTYGIYDADLDLGTNGITKYIAPSQGFFVKATSSSASIKFTENIKCINPGNNYFKSNSNSNGYSMLKLSISNDSSYTDETLVLFDDNASSTSNDQHDATKFFSDALNIYTLSSDNTNLSIDTRNIASKVDSIRLAVFSYNGSDVMTTSHTIVASNMENIPSTIDVILWDKFLNTYTDLKSNNRYEFMITTDNESWGKNRFIILVGDVNTGVFDNNEKSEIKIYPNPSKGDLYLTTSQEWIGKEINFSIVDQSGRTVYTGKSSINNLSTLIDISNIADGFYVLEVISEHKTNRLKFIKRQ